MSLDKKLIKIFLLATLLLLTVAVLLTKPKMHKNVRIENANFTVEEKDVDINTEEQTIQWNKWHSDLMNKILQAVIPSEPINTVNYIRFNVDNKRNISNIRITTEPSKYNKIAKDDYFDYINSLNGNQILQFPKNSKRKIVHVELKTIVTNGDSTEYTTPDDFSDYERIKR